MTKRILAVLVLIGTVVAAYRLLPRLLPLAEAAATDERSVSRALPVEVVTLQSENSCVQRRDFTGIIRSGRVSELGFELGGKVIQVRFDVGDTVKAGETIAELDVRKLRVELERTRSQLDGELARLRMLKKGPRDEVIAAAKANVETEKSNYQRQTRDLTRNQRLYRDRVVSAQELDGSTYGTQAMAARVNAAEAQLEELLAGSREEEIAAQEATVNQLVAAYRAIELQLDDSVLTAPFDGLVTHRRLDEGSVVSAGAAVVRLVEHQRLEAEIGIPVDLCNGLNAGRYYSLQTEQRSVQGRLRAILPEVDPATQTRLAVFDLEQDAATEVAIGQMVRVRVQREIPMQGYWLPTAAIERGQRGLWSAYVVGSDDGGAKVAQRRDLEVLFAEEQRVFVRGTVAAGDQVVSGGLHRLSSEQLVSVVNDTTMISANDKVEERR